MEDNIDKGKNVVWTQGNILNAANTIVKVLDLKQGMISSLQFISKISLGDVVIVPGYQQSSFGIIANFASFLSGASMTFPSGQFNAADTFKLLGIEKCTVLFIRRADIDALLAQPADQMFDKLRYIVTDQITEDEASNLKKRFTNVKVKSLGGLDDFNGLVTIDGKVIPGVEVKVTRNMDDRIVHKDTYGDLRVRGCTISKKLWNDIGLMNADVDEEGWVRTGRMGKIDNDGQLFIH